MAILFVADTHFDHRRIVELSGRPWPDVDAMNEGLVERWNAVVRPHDEVWHLGDFSLRKASVARWRPRLNGRIHLVLGNHDEPKAVAGHFESVQEVKWLRHEGLRFHLSHYAHRTWPNSIYGSFHLFGHSHGALPPYGRSMDVGVDANDYRPISLDEVVALLEARPLVDHHESGVVDGGA